MADWLIATLEFLDPNPPPKGAYMHLYLDLYKKEAGKVAASLSKNQSVQSGLAQRLILLAKEEVGYKAGKVAASLSKNQSVQSGLAQRLIPLAKEEVESARRVLSVIGAREELNRFNKAIVRYTEEELGIKFPEVRDDITKSLMNASYDRYRLTESGDPQEIVKQMIESASQRVYPIIAGYPDAVVDTKCRANELRFTRSCQDQVGRLLSVLACAVPSGGRILEIGTGVGVGTAWITAGLRERIDVEVISVEIDPVLSRAANKSKWPSYVKILTANALDILGTLGTFNLVFADASPIKYGHIDSVLKVLSPGGLLLVDDLEAAEQTTEVEQTTQSSKRDDFRRSLLHYADLNVVEIEWSTGIILVAKSIYPPAVYH